MSENQVESPSSRQLAS